MELYAFPALAILFVGMFTREVIAPASKNRCDRRWLLLASLLGASTVMVTLALGYLFAVQIERAAVISAARDWPDAAVGAASFLLTSFVFYWWHRATHASDLLWRLFHQLHHSPRRVEALTAFYAHPLDAAAAVLISAFSSYLALGASPVAAAWALFFTSGFDLFLHGDVRTPRWLGYFIQRPEMHTVHHAHGHHAQNYGLPIWDWLFGTWSNPEHRAERLGFDDEKADDIHAMLLCRDVHKSGG
ncbi:sterol desaturase family protein [Chromobacterium phragmitis]|uniref:Sterol desaturase family protein n=1 Tax=Chromobacterium phragmitis TaxID=2202141 RepID=A0ABV0IPK7_9NEIS